MSKPALIGPMVGLTVCLSGCGNRNPDTLELLGQTSTTHSIDVPIHQVSSQMPSPNDVLLPLDEEAKRAGKKVFARVPTSLRRNPWDTATESYRVGPGTALYIRQMDDKEWLEVRLAKGKRAYVKTDETTALALALAQGSLADKERLTPRSKQDQQVDAGDGKSGGASDRDPALDGAILDLQEAFAAFSDAWDRYRSDVSGFQTPNADWPSVRDACIQELNALNEATQDFSDEMRSITALSSNMTAAERAAYQSIVVHQGEVEASIATSRQTLNQMSEGSDWIQLIESLLENTQSLAGGVDGVRVNVAKLG